MTLKIKKNVIENYHLAQNKIKPYTILLVDDEQANLNVLTQILESDYNIITATNGAIALNIIKNNMSDNAIHLIISDQRMPQMTGVELFEKAVLLMPQSIRMLLTGFADMSAVIDAINCGAVYKFLTKPIEPFELSLMVKRALESFELTKKNELLMAELLELNMTLEHKIIERTHELAKKQQDLEQLNIELQKQLVIIERLSITDELTQLYNRRYFNIVFPKEIERAINEKQYLSFLMFDVDNFKAYNDNYGHLKGDDVLMTIGKLLNVYCHDVAKIPFRLGGEEFGVIFLNVAPEKALNFANDIRLAIANARIIHQFSRVADFITVSCGLITVLAKTELKMDYLYKKADDALYQAKQVKNSVVFVEC